jgi:hypothetical protein
MILRMRYEEKLTMILRLTFCFIIQTVYSLTVNDCMECVSNNKIFFKNLYPYSEHEFTCLHKNEPFPLGYLPLERACKRDDCADLLL